MHPFYYKAASFVAMPLVAASGYAGYSYYNNNNYNGQYQYGQAICTQLATDLYYNYGNNQNDVARLQQFFISRGYLQGSPNGTFDQATLTAIQRFQADNGLQITGIADSATRARIQQISCNGNTGNGGYGHGGYGNGGYGNGGYQNTNGQLSVYGVDAPRTLAVGQSGTFSVHVNGYSNYQGGGSLHYTVRWGDENQYGVQSAASYYPSTSVNSSGSFTHVYTQPGTYTPVFTVTDDYGHSTQGSATTQVTGGYTGQPVYGNTGSNSNYCNTNAGWYDRNCYNNTGSTYNGGTTGGYNGSTGNYPSGCTTYYDRACYVNGQYVGPSFGGSGYTYNGPGEGCYYTNGQWQGNCSSGNFNGGSYTNTNTNSNYCNTNAGYYDRNCHNTTGSSYNSNPYNTNTGSYYYGNGGYTSSIGGPNGPDYSCYYDRACLAQMQAQQGYTY